jgi:hypothetical protein
LRAAVLETVSISRPAPAIPLQSYIFRGNTPFPFSLNKEHSRPESVTRLLSHTQSTSLSLLRSFGVFWTREKLLPLTTLRALSILPCHRREKGIQGYLHFSPLLQHLILETDVKMQQFDTDFTFDMDDNFSLCSQPLSCPSTGTSFSSASSVYEVYTPSSRRSSPNELSMDFADGISYHGPEQSLSMTPPSMSKYMFGPIKQEPEQISFTSDTILPSTPHRKIDGSSYDYEQMLEMNMATHPSMGTITPSHSFGMGTVSPEVPSMGPTSYMLTPSRSLSSGPEVADPSTWATANDDPIAFFSGLGAPVELERHSQSPLGSHHPYGLHSNGPSPSNRFRMQRKLMLHEAQRKSSQLQKAQIRATRTRTEKHEAGTVDVVRRAMCKCDYPGCTKAFRRNEHLKRHKQT